MGDGVGGSVLCVNDVVAVEHRSCPVTRNLHCHLFIHASFHQILDCRTTEIMNGKASITWVGSPFNLSAPFSKYDNVLFVVFAPSLLCSLWEGTDLPRKSPYRIVLTKQEQEELERRANKYTLPYFIVARAKMILLAAQGLANDEIANSLSTRREIVSRWRKRFFEKRLGGLEDFPRPGRPRVFPPRAGRAR